MGKREEPQKVGEVKTNKWESNVELLLIHVAGNGLWRAMSNENTVPSLSVHGCKCGGGFRIRQRYQDLVTFYFR